MVGERVLAAGVGAEIEAEVEDEFVVGQAEIGALQAGFGRRDRHRRRHQKNRLGRRRRDRFIGEPAGDPDLLNKGEGGSPLLGEFGQFPGPIADRIAPLDAAFPQKQVIEKCRVGIQVHEVDAGRLGECGGRPAVLRRDRPGEAVEHRPLPAVPAERERAHAQIFGAPGDEAGITDQAKIARDRRLCGRFWHSLRDAVIQFEFLDSLADPPLEQSRAAFMRAQIAARLQFRPQLPQPDGEIVERHEGVRRLRRDPRQPFQRAADKAARPAIAPAHARRMPTPLRRTALAEYAGIAGRYRDTVHHRAAP